GAHQGHGVPRPRAGVRALALPRLRPRPRLGPGELQARLPGQPARPAGDPPAAHRGRVHLRPRSRLGADRRVPLPGLLHADRDGVPAAGPPRHPRHRDRPRPPALPRRGGRAHRARRAPGREGGL
ncbi:MAG: Acetophenone carboxylase subunit Apc2, partial [uncultured Solirubrobacteraceae bacterium]